MSGLSGLRKEADVKLLRAAPCFGQVTKGAQAAAHSPPPGLGFTATYVRDQTDCEVQKSQHEAKN